MTEESTEQETEDIPTSFSGGRYVIQRLLARGGMGAVYLADDTRLEIECALKATNLKESSEDVLKRFEREAKIMARLKHPNIVRVSDYGIEEKESFLVMELVLGGSLNDLVRANGPMPPHLAAEVIVGLLAGLQAAHDAGVIHRDIKPHNVLISELGVPKLTDFGIAQENREDFRTTTGMIMGTLSFMAPEQQLDSSSVGPTVDIYAVGATLFYLLTGKDPVLLHNPEVLNSKAEGLDPSLRSVLERACSFFPENRYPSSEAMGSEMLGLLPDLTRSDYGWSPKESLISAFMPNSSSGGARETLEMEDDISPTLAPYAEPSGIRSMVKFLGIALVGLAGVSAALFGYLFVNGLSQESTGEVSEFEVVETKSIPIHSTAPSKTREKGESSGEEESAKTSKKVTPILTPIEPKKVSKTRPKKQTPKSDGDKKPAPDLVVVEVVPDSPPPPVAMVEFFINATPLSTIFIDGQRIPRMTPVRTTIASGSHRIRIVDDEEQRVHEVTLNIDQNNRRFCWDFSKSDECRR